MIREDIILKLIEGKDILDIGSVGQTDAYSLWDLYQSSNATSVTGIDLPSAETERNKTFGATARHRASSIVTGNMETYDFSRQFDVIIAGDVIEHVENQGLFLDNIHRHLHDAGRLVITTPNAKWFTVIHKPNPTHTLWHDRYTLERALQLAHFEVISWRYYYGNKPSYNFIERMLTLRQGIISISKKA